MKLLQFQSHDQKYEPVQPDDSLSPTIYSPTKPTGQSWWRALLFYLSLLAIILLGFVLGRISQNTQQQQAHRDLILPYGDHFETWQPDPKFASPPSPETEAAWQSLVPHGRGFFNHPEISPNVSGIAVFHQLHCLHGMRVAFFGLKHSLELLNGTTATQPDRFIQMQAATESFGHVEHCLEYLRRVILCAADSNLEQVIPETDDVTGWGFQRQCRSFENVKAFAETWRNSSATGIV